MGTNREEESDTTNNGLILWIDVSAREDRSRLPEALRLAALEGLGIVAGGGGSGGREAAPSWCEGRGLWQIH
jgi:hypothetical protein